MRAGEGIKFLARWLKPRFPLRLAGQFRPRKPSSLRLRLSLFFSALLLAAWLTAGVISWQVNRGYIDEFFDTQQMLFAKRLASADFGSLSSHLPDTREVLRGTPKQLRGEEEDDSLGFAVFGGAGRMLLNDGEEGDNFIFDKNARGFVTARIRGDDDPWRMVWLPSRDGGLRVAVGQSLEYRMEAALDMAVPQLLVWLAMLPVLLAGLIWLISRQLAPLRGTARSLETRRPQDNSPLSDAGLPSEVLPMIRALNKLFARTVSMIDRERAFVSDAAHELRTPLTALKIQTEVALMAGENSGKREHALRKLLGGIDRNARLVEQLLLLSRIDAFQASGESASCPGLSRSRPDWAGLAGEAVLDARPRAEAKNLTVTQELESVPDLKEGYPLLLSMMLRNLLDNAVKYTPEGGEIRVSLHKNGLRLFNSGGGAPEDCLARLGERFFRPPGQSESGSGLGLSIVRRVAAIHGMSCAFRNVETGEGRGTAGFEAKVEIIEA